MKVYSRKVQREFALCVQELTLDRALRNVLERMTPNDHPVEDDAERIEIGAEKEYMDVMMQGIDVFRTYVLAWYDGSLQTIFYADKTDPTVTSQIYSVLAGYVWDTTNPYVAEHDKNIKRLVHLIDVNKRIASFQ